MERQTVALEGNGAEPVAVATRSSKVTPRVPTLSQEEIERWLSFQFQPSSYIDSSYRSSLLGSATARGSTRAKDKLANSVDALSLLWGNPALSRYLCEIFSLEFADFPKQSSSLSFFTRLVMIDATDLRRLLQLMGLLLSSHELSLVIDREVVVKLRSGLGDADYDFATGRGRALAPSNDWISLSLNARSRLRLTESSFHIELGLRLLLLHGKSELSAQSLKRLGLKCPQSVVSRVESCDGLEVGLATFEREDDRSRKESLWGALVKEELGRWHDWLVS